MRVLIALTFLYLLALPGGAAAQPWREAYDRGEVEKAANLLHAIVLERNHDDMDFFPPVEATVQLAKMYLTGTGVKADQIRACGLLFVAERAEAMTHYPDPLLPKAPVARLHEEHCSSLSDDDRKDGILLTNCFNYGLEPRVFVLEPGHSAEITPRGITIHHEGANSFHETLNNTAFCAPQIALVRYTRVDPPLDAEGAARHLVEFFAWKSNRNREKLHRALEWQLWEVLGADFQFRAHELLMHDEQSAWPPSGVPDRFHRVAFQMRRNGQILWRFNDATQTGGIEALPIASKPR